MKSYSLKSDGFFNNCHLVHWAIEGSNDGSEWKVIDTRDTRDLNGNYIVKTYDCECNQVNKEYYQYLRLRQTGKNYNHCDNLMLSELEMFGILR